MKDEQMAKGRTMSRLRTSVLLGFAAIVLLAIGVNGADGAASKWFQVGLATGEVSGYSWAVLAKGESGVRLRRLCVTVRMAEPPNEEQLPVEEEDVTACGRLRDSADHVVATNSFGAGSSKVALLAIAVRPVVKRVVLSFFAGEKPRVVHTAAPEAVSRHNRVSRFRYVAVPFEGQSCIRRITAQDGRRNIVFSQPLSRCQLP
jgi:hypothetical protein